MIIDISDDGYKVTIILKEGKKEINTTIDELVDCYLEKIDKNFFDRKTCFDCEYYKDNVLPYENICKKNHTHVNPCNEDYCDDYKKTT